MRIDYTLLLRGSFIGSLILFSAIGFTPRMGRAQTAAVSVEDTLTAPVGNIQPSVASGFVSFHAPDGMILSTGNIYFTSHDSAGAHVFRTSQTSVAGQEIESYHEPPGSQFGDIVFANVGGTFFGYFFSQSSGQATIKRILLTGSQVATVLTPPINDIDIVNSHHNLATDGVNLYWQDVSAIRKMPLAGGTITTLDSASPNTPTAGVYLSNGNVYYASVNSLRYVPAAGSIVSPLFRTIAIDATTITAILPVANGIYWGDRDGEIFLRSGSSTSTVQGTGLIPGSMGTDTSLAGGALAWTLCASTTCQLRVSLHFPVLNAVIAISGNALGASMNSSGTVFWGDASGLHRFAF